jgi:hypothetical protein
MDNVAWLLVENVTLIYSRRFEYSINGIVHPSALRILRISDATDKAPLDHKFVVGRGGYRIEASRNMFSGSGLKYDNILTDVLWGHHSQ